MSSPHQIFTVGILVYPGAQLSAVYGLVDLLQTANRYQLDQGCSNVDVSVECIDTGFDLPQRKYVAIILPPSLEDRPLEDEFSKWIEWISTQHSQGTLLCSICAGAFLLAKTGILKGRPATTHWALGERFSAQFPEVQLDTDRLIIDDGDVITAGGLMAWLDLGLRLVARFWGSAVMLSTARFFLIDPSGREQRFYSPFSPSLAHGDAQVLRVQHWLQSHSHKPITVVDMAAVANLSERTFLRRFSKATKLNPSEYVQHLRIGRARELIEQSNLGIDAIAWQVGYQDPSAFRRTFYKIMGLTPKEYRNRFSGGFTYQTVEKNQK